MNNNALAQEKLDVAICHENLLKALPFYSETYHI
jgi:hypothetical protein